MRGASAAWTMYVRARSGAVLICVDERLHFIGKLACAGRVQPDEEPELMRHRLPGVLDFALLGHAVGALRKNETRELDALLGPFERTPQLPMQSFVGFAWHERRRNEAIPLQATARRGSAKDLAAFRSEPPLRSSSDPGQRRRVGCAAVLDRRTRRLREAYRPPASHRDLASSSGLNGHGGCLPQPTICSGSTISSLRYSNIFVADGK
jgi:hypothetical protein